MYHFRTSWTETIDEQWIPLNLIFLFGLSGSNGFVLTPHTHHFLSETLKTNNSEACHVDMWLHGAVGIEWSEDRLDPMSVPFPFSEACIFFITR